MKVVHVGFPKTATTFLQTRVFTSLPRSFVYYGKTACTPFFAALMDHDDTIFDLGSARAAFAAAWRDSEHCLFSYEPLTGNHYRSGFVNRTLIAERLRAVGFDRAILTIRNQFDALESAYKEYVKSGGTLRCGEYLGLDPGKPRYLYPEYFDYLPIYRLYAGIFGPSNVLLLQYEQLGSPAFERCLWRFLGAETGAASFHAAPVNTSLSHDKTAILRVINHFTCSAYQPSHLFSRRISTAFFYRRLAALPFLNREKSFLDDPKRRAITELFGEANAELERVAGISLAAAYPRAAASGSAPLARARAAQ